MKHTIEIKDYSNLSWLKAAQECLDEITQTEGVAFRSTLDGVRQELDILIQWEIDDSE